MFSNADFSKSSDISKVTPTEPIFQPHQTRMIDGYVEEMHQKPAYDVKPLLQRLFPSQQEKLAKNKELEAIATQHEYRRKMLEIVGEGLCEDLRLRCAKQLEANRIQLDTLTKKIVLSQFMEFKADYNKRVREIFRDLHDELQELECYTDKSLRDKYMEHLSRNFASSESTLEAIWTQFIKNLIDNLR